ncbi:MAG: hypothetical protein LBT46_00820 [Planctomycetaceae bacterium]|nr:hypothetical protein [Planctomycetaceae bacterium]
MSDTCTNFCTQTFAEEASSPFPIERLYQDWMYQDHGLKINDCFQSSENAKIESAMVQKVLSEVDDKSLAETAKTLESVAGNDPRWKELYIKSCELRRQKRIAILIGKKKETTTQTPFNLVYAKHSVMGGLAHYSWTDDLTDQQRVMRYGDLRPGAQLCLLTINADGKIENKVLFETKTGLLRDPAVSYDATKIVFSMRNSFDEDDYHLYVMDLSNNNNVVQITKDKAVSDTEPCWLPDDNIVYLSTRCSQACDCDLPQIANIYTCDRKGNFVRRIGFDQVHTNYPQVLDNGTVIYTRWEYNDRSQIWAQPLFMMNPDGTAQTEFYGNNSWFPTSILHARGVPGTEKVIAIASGHHTPQIGKLIMIDRARGTQENQGVQLIAPIRETKADKIDRLGQGGELFQYPFAINEREFLVAYLPEGVYPETQIGGFYNERYKTPFGIYWFDIDGRRELLAYDPTISSGQQSPLIVREKPILKASQVDLTQSTGKYYVQDVYAGPGLKGIRRGTVKKLRVVALEFRAAVIQTNSNKGEGGRSHVRTPISINNGSWDVKHVLGELLVEDDGSVYFEVPARTPIYFQLLDEKGYVVQTMRSWSTLQPGETFACIGCHEDKNSVIIAKRVTLAQQKLPQKLLPDAYKNGGIDSVGSYLGVNRARGVAEKQSAGFSYPRQIQPIWDKHCVSCHNGSVPQDDDVAAKQSALDLSGKVLAYDWNRPPNNGDRSQRALRNFSASYLNLTNYGYGNNAFVNWISSQCRPTMLEPYAYGAAKSKIINFLEPKHYNVNLSAEEKQLVACWIDLCIPFCGSYVEANQWSDKEKATYEYFENKRTKFAEVELENIRKLNNGKL